MEPTIEKVVTEFVPTGEPVEGKRAGKSGRGWSSQEGTATVVTTTTTYREEVDPETGETVFVVDQVTSETEEGVVLTQSMNPGGKAVYKGLDD